MQTEGRTIYTESEIGEKLKQKSLAIKDGGLEGNRTLASRFCLAEPDLAPRDRQLVSTSPH